ncbi:MAG: hypothetical protein KC466_17525, partial [Myxococcales bacterium]|nr:hypothetical protein [Myxococcales bacterium]
SPLRYLIEIEATRILAGLFVTVAIPPAVLDELKHPRAPYAVRTWAKSVPDWISVRSVARLDKSLELGRGETEAISLAVESNADRLIVDDLKARAAARSRGVVTVGTIAVLEVAAAQDLLSLPDAVRRLRATSFRASDALLAAALLRDRARRGSR